MSVPTAQPRLDPVRREMCERAYAHVTADRLRDAIRAMTAIASPTGDEGPLADHLCGELAVAGLDSHLQPLDDRQANAWGRLTGSGAGPDLMLYAPIDTLTTGDPAEDLPWAGPELRADMRAEPVIDGDQVIGLGASNPKGHAACVLVAASALAAAGLPFEGDLIAAFGAGGMPTNALRTGDDARRHTGQGVGCSFLLEQGVWADYAVIAKPGWTVSHEEVGLAWFEVTVRGTHTYVGSRHRLPYRNAIADAGRLIAELEQWFSEYARRHTYDTFAPQGVVSAVEAGWMRMAAVTPAACRFRLDLRLAADTSPLDAKRELAAAVAGIAGRLGVEADVRPVLAIPGSRTDPASWITRASVAAFEDVTGRPHEPVTGNSGATDANILRNRGIPTVRVGMPKARTAPWGCDDSGLDFAMGMNTVEVPEMVRLTRLLIAIAVGTCTRTRIDLGMAA